MKKSSLIIGCLSILIILLLYSSFMLVQQNNDLHAVHESNISSLEALNIALEEYKQLYEETMIKNEDLELKIQSLKVQQAILKENSNKSTITVNASKKDIIASAMRAFAISLQLSDAQFNHGYEKYQDVYKIHSDYVEENEWIVVSGDQFEIEVLGYEDAKSVQFYYYKNETCMTNTLLGTDDSVEDGWRLTMDDFSDYVELNPYNLYEYPCSSSILAEVKLKNGDIVRLPIIPIFNRMLEE